MKRLPLAAITLLLAALPAFGQNTTWLGISANWGQPSNWSNGVPTTSSTVVFASNAISFNPGLDADRTISSFDYQRTNNGLTLDRASVDGKILPVTNNFTVEAGTARLVVRRIGLSVRGTLDINGHLDLGDPNVSSALASSSVYNIFAANTARTSGTINLSRSASGSSVNLGNLVMDQGVLNLTAGSSTLGSDIAVENVVNLSSLITKTVATA